MLLGGNKGYSVSMIPIKLLIMVCVCTLSLADVAKSHAKTANRFKRQQRYGPSALNTSLAHIANCPRGCLCMSLPSSFPGLPAAPVIQPGLFPAQGDITVPITSGGTQVICSRADLKILPRDLPRDCVKLDLSQNDISFIPSRAFEGLPIHTLILDDNEIREIKAYAFAGMPRLQNLLMKNNPIDVLGQNSMSGIIGAVTINLGSNHIDRVEREAFEDSAHIQSINLAENPLTYVKTKAFRGLKNVQYLILSSSGLKNLEPGCFDGLSNVDYIAITQVPLKNLEANTFRGLKNVGNLEIRMAKIQKIQDFAFRGANNLSRVTLSEVGLETLGKRAFRGLQGPPIQRLDLSRNKLRYIHSFLFVDWAKHVIQLDLSDNPVSCNNCNLTWVTQAAKYFTPPTPLRTAGHSYPAATGSGQQSINETFSVYLNPEHIDQLRCASPAYLKGKRVRDINFKAEFGCDDPIPFDLVAMLKKDTTSGSTLTHIATKLLFVVATITWLSYPLI